MSPPASSTAIPSCKESDDYEYDSDDPLLDYCEDYAWDPPDWDLETEDSSGYWDLSEKDDFTATTNQDNTVKYIPPQPSKVSPLLQAGTTFRSLRETHVVPHHVELDMNFFQVKEAHGIQQGNNIGFRALIYKFLLKYCGVMKKKALRLEIKTMKWIFFKWLFVVLNVVIEVCQATFSQENAQGKLSTPFYLKLNIITSAFCLMMSLVETVYEGTKRRVVWRKRGCFGWFYYPGRQRRLFGRFSLIFGVVSSIVQLSINLVALVINKNFLKFDTLPLLLSIGYLISAMVGSGGKDMTKRKVHGRCLKQCCSLSGVEGANQPFRSIQISSGWSYASDEALNSVSDQFGSCSNMLSIKIL